LRIKGIDPKASPTGSLVQKHKERGSGFQIGED